MTILIAVHTIHGARQTRVPTERQLEVNPKDKGDFEPIMVAPGKSFDTADLGISEDEARSLVQSGAARERGRLEAAEHSAATDVATHPPADGLTADDLPSDEELASMTRAQLEALAQERGVDVSQARSKADVIAALIDSVEGV